MQSEHVCCGALIENWSLVVLDRRRLHFYTQNCSPVNNSSWCLGFHDTTSDIASVDFHIVTNRWALLVVGGFHDNSALPNWMHECPNSYDKRPNYRLNEILNLNHSISSSHACAGQEQPPTDDYKKGFSRVNYVRHCIIIIHTSFRKVKLN